MRITLLSAYRPIMAATVVAVIAMVVMLPGAMEQKVRMEVVPVDTAEAAIRTTEDMVEVHIKDQVVLVRHWDSVEYMGDTLDHLGMCSSILRQEISQNAQRSISQKKALSRLARGTMFVAQS